MSRNLNYESEHVRVELKYCEHCGGLWVREGGRGVYCGKCEGKVADLPPAKKKAGRLTLPRLDKPVVERLGPASSEDSTDLKAMGGVAC